MSQYENERSSFWPLATVGALGTGVGVGMSKNWEDLLNASKGGGSTRFAALEKAVSEIPKFKEPVYSFAKDSLIGEVAGLETSPAMQSNLKDDIAATAYESIMKGKKAVGHKDAHGIFEKIRSAPTIEKAYDAAQKEISNMGGDSNLFSRRMEETVFKDGFYNKDRAKIAAASSGKYQEMSFRVAAAEKTLGRSDLSDEGMKTAKRVEERLRLLLSNKNMDYSSKFFKAGPQEMMQVTTMGDTGRPVQMSFPLRESVKETRVGKGLGTRYLTRSAWDLTASGDIKQKSFTQFYLDTLEANISKAQSGAGVKRAIRNSMEHIQEKAMVWAPPREFLSSGAVAKEAFVTSQSVYAGKSPTPGILNKAMSGANPMYPVGSPKQVAEGILSTVDWRKKLMGPMHELMPYEKNPMQFMRDWTLNEMSVTEQGGTHGRKGAAGEFRSRFAPVVGGEGFEEAMKGYTSPRLNTFYLKKLTKEQADNLGVQQYSKYLAEEMGIMSREGAALQQWNRVKGQKFRLAEGFDLNKNVLTHMKENVPEIGVPQVFDKPIPLNEGETLGVDIKTNRNLTVKRQAGLRRSLLGYEVLDSGRVKLNIQETSHLGKGQVAKFFSHGSSAKHTIARGDPGTFLNEVLGIKKDDVDLLIPGERIDRAKNPYAVATQQIEALEHFTGKRIDSVRKQIAKANTAGNLQDVATKQKSLTKLEGFMKDPEQFLGLNEELMEKSKIAGAPDVERLSLLTQNRIAVGAKKLGLKNNSILPEIFGLMDEKDVTDMVALAEDLGEETLAPKEASRLQAAIKRSTGVHGTPQLFLGDLLTDMGGGNIAPYEPSMFHWLSKTGPDDLGARLAADMESRLSPSRSPASGPAIEDLTRMQRSFLGEGGDLIDQALGGFPEAEDFRTIARGDMIRDKGYWADLGKNLEDIGGRRIYIAGTDAVPSLGAARTSTGELVASELEDALYGLQYSLADKSDNAARKVQESVKHLQALGQAEWASSVTLRDRALGSRYIPSQRLPMTDLVGGAEDMADELASKTHRISKRTGVEMFEEMLASAPTAKTKEFIEAQQIAFLNKERLPGTVGRFPAEGPYSIQPTFVQMIEELDAPGVRGNRALDNTIYAPAVEDTLSIKGLKKEFIPKAVSVGQDVGQRLDWDLDHQIISFIGDQQAAKDATRYLAGEMGEEYTQYLGKHYMLKELFKQNEPEAVSLARGEAERLGGAARHSTGQMTIGKTNIALDKFRRGIAMQPQAIQQTYEPLLWHMEETATIMAKHGGAHAGTKMADTYTRAAMAIESGDTGLGGRLMTEAIESLGGKEALDMQASFANSGADIAYSYDPARMGRQLAESYSQHHEEIRRGADISKAAKASYINSTKEANLEAMMLHDSRGSLDAAQRMASQRGMGAAGIGAKAQRFARAGKSRWRAVANVLKRGKGPMALGVAAAAGIMLMSPSISGSISINPNMQGPAGGRNLRPEDSIPANGAGITPPPSGMRISPSTYHQGGVSTKVNMSNTSSDFSGDTYQAAMMQMRSMRTANMNTRMNVSDNRASLDPSMLADKIYRSM